jgi:cobalt transporter subunit CbtB
MATAPTTVSSINAPARTLPALAAIFLGLALFVTAGFAWPEAIHNATHDTRHALGLPCH